MFKNAKAFNSDISIAGNITSGVWSGTAISVTKGGTGLTSPGAAGNVLLSDGTNWISSSSGVGVNTLTYTTSSSYAKGGTISGTTLTLAAADASNPELISRGAQTIAGSKTFNSDLTINGLTAGAGQGTGNSVFGQGALTTNTNGVYNVAVGYNSLHSSNSTQRNTAIGQASLGSITTGNDNVAIGNAAGQYQDQAQTLNTSANQSVFLGAFTYSGFLNPTNEIVIGYQAAGNGDNTTTIGNSSTQKSQIRGALTITPNTAPSLTDGNSTTIAAQNAGSGGTNAGGNVYITAGDANSSGNGGDIILTGGSSTTSQYTGSLFVNTSSFFIVSINSFAISSPYLIVKNFSARLTMTPGISIMSGMSRTFSYINKHLRIEFENALMSKSGVAFSFSSNKMLKLSLLRDSSFFSFWVVSKD